MSIPYPDKPWVDEQTFSYTTDGGVDLVGTYFIATNSWSFSDADELFDFSSRLQALEQQVALLMGNQS